MRKKLSTLLILILIFGGMLYLRSHKKAEPIQEGSTEQIESTSEIVTAAQSITLGTMTANENGGVTITLPKEGGTEEIYSFDDVAPDSWYANAVNFVVSAGLMKGTEEEASFLPEYGIQRVDYAIVIYRYAGGEEVTKKANFSDLTGKEWFAPYINWISAKGYMGATEDGAFSPYGYLTVEQAIVVLYRYVGEPYIDGSLADYPYAPKISEGAIDAMTWAWNKGIIAEEECVWYPTQAISRAQVALLLTRCSNMLEQVS